MRLIYLLLESNKRCRRTNVKNWKKLNIFYFVHFFISCEREIFGVEGGEILMKYYKKAWNLLGFGSLLTEIKLFEYYVTRERNK